MAIQILVPDIGQVVLVQIEHAADRQAIGRRRRADVNITHRRAS
jgi:hypothetical protein